MEYASAFLRSRLSRAICTCLLLSTSSVILLAHAQTNTPVDIKLPTGPLGDTISDIGEAFGLNIAVDESIIANQIASAVYNPATALDAIKQALVGTSLTATLTEDGVILITESQSISKTSALSSEQSQAAPQNKSLVERIVVTGEKVDRTLVETRSSVSVLSNENLNESVILNLEDALQRIPNVTIAPGGFSLSIRGISQLGVGVGSLDPVANTSAIYIDGAVQTLGAVGNGVLSTWDLKQVEVYRGPQNATQGRSGLAGAVIVETADPTPYFSGRGRVISNNQNMQQASFALSGPLIGDVLSFRIAGETVEDDGFTEFRVGDTVVDDIGRNQRDFLRGKLHYTPTERLEAILSFTHVEGERGINNVNGPNFFEGISTEIASIRDSDAFTSSLRVKYEISDTLVIESVTSLADLEFTESSDERTLSGTGFDRPTISNERAFSQEIRFTYDDSGDIQALFGAYYAEIEEAFDRNVEGIIPTPVGTFDVISQDGFERDFENFALFGQVEYQFHRHFSLLLGGRFESEDRRYLNYNFRDVTPDSPFITDRNDIFEGDGDDSAFLPKVAFIYDIDENMSLSLTLQQGYRPGITSFNPFTFEEIQVEPEETNNIDLAYRASMLDGSLITSINVFYVDYQDMQIRVALDPLLPFDRFIDNAGEAELYGVELESLFELNEQWSFYASAAYQHSELKEFFAGTQDLSGEEIPFSPSFSAAIGGTWNHPSGWNGTLDISYEGDYVSGANPAGPTQRVSSYTLVDGRFGYDFDNWGVYLFAENILDREYLGSVVRGAAFEQLDTGILGQPRTVGFIVEADF